jgi:hypothetical protein
MVPAAAFSTPTALQRPAAALATTATTGGIQDEKALEGLASVRPLFLLRAGA